MIITTTAYITATGGIRLATAKGKARKGELAITLALDVPDTVFAPAPITMRATLAPPAAMPAPTPVVHRNGNGSGEPWTAERIRLVRAATGMTEEEFARAVGVTLGIVREWERTPRPMTPSNAILARLAELEQSAHAQAAS